MDLRGSGLKGLDLLWSPPPESIEHNLVLVHGLDGDALSTWTHDNGQCWPKHFLPKYEGLANVRVLTFAYAAISAEQLVEQDFVGSHGRILTFGEELCSDLRDLKIEERPITFLGHGVGGIVVKSALTYCQAHPSQYAGILKSTRHVMFLDTPHQGINEEAWKAISGKVASKKGLLQWGLWSNVLQDLGRTFAEIAPKFNISSVYASLLLGAGRPDEQVVPGTSGLTLAKHERLLHLDGVSHLNMCKFSADIDINCQRLLARLKIGQTGPGAYDERVSLLREWIMDANNINKAEHEEHLEQHCDGTCTWLLKDETFQRWIDKQGYLQSIWVTAESGSGKTILCSFALKHTLEMPIRPSAAYLFLKFDSHPTRLSMLRMIASGLLDHAMEDDNIPESAYITLQKSKLEVQSLEELVKKLVAAESQRGLVFLFIDGLNEVGDAKSISDRANREMAEKEIKDTEKVVRFLHKLSGGMKNLRLWFSSQKDDRTTRWMAGIHELAIPSEHAGRDVQKYLVTEVKSKISSNIQDPMTKLLTLMSLHTNADYNFRWAAMMVDGIVKCENDEQALKMARRDVPFRLSELYEDSLNRLQNKDKEDQLERECIGLSRSILSMLVFANRPLKLKELQEAISARCLSLDIKGSKHGCPNISPLSISHADRLVNRCSPFVTYVPGTDGTQNGTFRLSHQSVLKFLIGIQWPTNDIVDGRFMAEACLNYLFQARYSKLLVKESASNFRTYWGTNIREHHFLRYCAKYWYRHMESIKPTESDRENLVAFVKSPQFITCIQVQSLFVDGHFIQYLDDHDRSKRIIKKNLPDWLVDCGGKKLMRDYLDFLAEWGSFLKRGITENANGELDRCLWSTLGSENYFSRYQDLQRHPAHLLRVGAGPASSSPSCVETPLYDYKTMVLWKSNHDQQESSDRMCLEQQTWVLDDACPRLKDTTIYVLPVGSDYLKLYDFSRARTFPLSANLNTPGRCLPVAFSSHPNRLRFGAGEIVNQGNTWILNTENPTSSQNSYWEDINFRAPYRIKSRRRALKEYPKCGKIHDPMKTSGSSGDEYDGSESEDTSDTGNSDPSNGPSSASERSVSDSESEGASSRSDSKPETELSDDVNSDWTPEKRLSDDGDSDVFSDVTDTFPEMRPSHTPTWRHSRMRSIRLSGWQNSRMSSFRDHILATLGDSSYQHSSEDESEDESEDDNSREKIPDLTSDELSDDTDRSAKAKMMRSGIHCDICKAKDVKIFFSCNQCIENNTFDVCSQCRKDGHWCKDRFHPLTNRHVNSVGKRFVDGMTSVYQCKAKQQVVVERLGPGSQKTIFRYRRHDNKSRPLYDSPPVMHPTKPLLAWPLDGCTMMFANVEENVFFTRPLRSDSLHPITVKAHFSQCGEFFYAASIYKSFGSRVSIDVWSCRLPLDPTRHRAPETLSRLRVNLGLEPRKMVTQIPFYLNWERDDVYLTMSAERLRVYKIPLRTDPRLNNRPVTTIKNEIVLPRSARDRSVYFFPQKDPASSSIVVVGPREGGEAPDPIVIYLDRAALGKWVEAGEAHNFDVNERRRKDPLREGFDSDDDCDMVPYDPNFQC